MALGEEKVWLELPNDRSVSHEELVEIILKPGYGFSTGYEWRDAQIVPAAIGWLVSGGWISAEIDNSRPQPRGATQVYRYRKIRTPRVVTERERERAEAARHRAAVATATNGPIDRRLAELGLLPQGAAAQDTAA